LSLRWDFGDGDTSVQTNPSHVFTNGSNTQDSTYDIRLIVTASSGCSDTIIKRFTAFGEPLANFGAKEVCEYKSTIFTDSSLAGGKALSKWRWNFDDTFSDTVQNPNHIYNQDGTYNVKLIVINGHGCIDSITKSILSYPIPLLSFSYDTIVCEKDSIFLNNKTTGAIQYDWSFGNGISDNRKSPNAYYDTIGFYTIRHIATSDFGCYDSLSKSIQVIGAPQASFAPSIDEGCAPLEVSFLNTSIAEYSKYKWDYGQGDTSIGSTADTLVYQQGRHDTTYYVQLIISNQCKIDTFIDSILVHPTPVALFETDRDIGCSPLNLQFSNNLTYGDPDTLIWNFGDGSPVYKTTKNTFDEPLTHSFTTNRLPSDYTITYIAKNNCGADTAEKIVTVYKTVEAFFNTDTLRGCFPLTVNFTNYSRGHIDYAWDFGDGNVSNVNNPSHTFTQVGTFTVKLFVTDSCSYDTFEQQVLIYPEPTVSFDFIKDSICQFDSIQFISTSNNVSGVYWDFGDGDSSRLNNVSHQFDNSGTFNVKYTGYSTLHNCPATISKDVNILARPKSKISANPEDGCQPLTVDFKADSSYNSWSFSNGNISILNNPKEVFTDIGNQWVKLVSEYANGCKDSTSMNLVVHPRPLAGFVASVDSLCEYPVDVNYTNTSIGALGYNWIFGDGSRSTQTNPSLVLTSVGTYNDTLIASNQFGCLDTAISIIKVYDAPVADALISPLNGCVPLEVNFDNLSTNYLYNKWEFGNGDTSNQSDEIYTYDVVGSYLPSLIVYGNANCTDTFKLLSTIDVYPNPIADFDFDTENIKTTYTNNSVGADSYLWNFGDGESSIEENPIHQFPGSGIFNTLLIASNNFGCRDSILKTVDIMEKYTLFVSNAFSPEFGGSGVRTFKPTGIGLAEYQIYIYDSWGNLIWESDKLFKSEPLEGWDGKDLEGNDMPQDTYVWKISAKFLNGRIWLGKTFPDGSVKRFGTVTLIR
jgi:PKD repeat protein